MDILAAVVVLVLIGIALVLASNWVGSESDPERNKH